MGFRASTSLLTGTLAQVEAAEPIQFSYVGSVHQLRASYTQLGSNPGAAVDLAQPALVQPEVRSTSIDPQITDRTPPPSPT